MISNYDNKSKDLDVTISSDISELEKALLQVKSLRYQMYTKFLSEKLFYETQLRKLENSNSHSSFNFNELKNTQNRLKFSLQERSLNSISMNYKKSSDKSIQTCDFHIPNISVTSLASSKKSFEDT